MRIEVSALADREEATVAGLQASGSGSSVRHTGGSLRVRVHTWAHGFGVVSQGGGRVELGECSIRCDAPFATGVLAE